LIDKPEPLLYHLIPKTRRIEMKIKYLGHAAFLVTSSDGTRVLIDPYETGCFDGAVKYGTITERADIVACSHQHADHYGIKDLPSGYELVEGAGDRTVKGIPIHGVATFHDESHGGERGENVIFVFEIDGMRLVHLGDLGHPLSDEEVGRIGRVDVLLVPVGGYFTIDAPVAQDTVNKLNPRLVIPMHYKTPSVDFPIAPVDDFIEGKENVKTVGASEVEVTALPDAKEIWVLEHGL
jgi:L-ascorbate metabolism protein UlaG (beta-lactamase superfamily)